MILLTVVFIFLIGAFKAFSDLSAEGRINPKGESSDNKWKLDEKGELIPQTYAPWYYGFLYKPEHKERFPYSSTYLVRFTDFWHNIEGNRFLAVIGAILSFRKIPGEILTSGGIVVLAAFIILTIRTIGFTINYELMKRTLKKKRGKAFYGMLALLDMAAIAAIWFLLTLILQ